MLYVFRDPYILAIRSVTLPTHPPTEDTNRGEMLCAGFTIYAESENVSKVSAYVLYSLKGKLSIHRFINGVTFAREITSIQDTCLLVLVIFYLVTRSLTTTRPTPGCCRTSPQTSPDSRPVSVPPSFPAAST